MADNQPMWGNNRAISPTPKAAIIAVDLGDNFTVKGIHLSMIKYRQFDGRARADLDKHIAEFVKICRIEDEADEAKEEEEPPSSKKNKSDPPPLKAYKLKIPYPQCLCKKKMEEQYPKVIDLIKEVRINVPLVDVLAGMPNYGKFLKDLMSNRSKIEQISAAFLNKECFTIVQNKLPPKLGDPESFLIPYTLANSFECLALADLGASINLMSYSLYASLYVRTLKPTRMSICLANHTYQYLMGVAENMLVQVGKFVFPVDFIILEMEEDNKAMQHSHFSDDTCFCMDVVDEVTEEELVALLNDYEPFLSTSEKINETSLDKEFKEFMVVDIDEILEQEEEIDHNFEC
ncbi:reverse transcriptase domain-containing protein [Tanacetum coccineum]